MTDYCLYGSQQEARQSLLCRALRAQQARSFALEPVNVQRQQLNACPSALWCSEGNINNMRVACCQADTHPVGKNWRDADHLQRVGCLLQAGRVVGNDVCSQARASAQPRPPGDRRPGCTHISDPCLNTPAASAVTPQPNQRDSLWSWTQQRGQQQISRRWLQLAKTQSAAGSLAHWHRPACRLVVAACTSAVITTVAAACSTPLRCRSPSVDQWRQHAQQQGSHEWQLLTLEQIAP